MYGALEGVGKHLLAPVLFVVFGGNGKKECLGSLGIGLVISESHGSSLFPVRNTFNPVIDHYSGQDRLLLMSGINDMLRIHHHVGEGISDVVLTFDGCSKPLADVGIIVNRCQLHRNNSGCVDVVTLLVQSHLMQIHHRLLYPSEVANHGFNFHVGDIQKPLSLGLFCQIGDWHIVIRTERRYNQIT